MTVFQPVCKAAAAGTSELAVTLVVVMCVFTLFKDRVL